MRALRRTHKVRTLYASRCVHLLAFVRSHHDVHYLCATFTSCAHICLMLCVAVDCRFLGGVANRQPHRRTPAVDRGLALAVCTKTRVQPTTDVSLLFLMGMSNLRGRAGSRCNATYRQKFGSLEQLLLQNNTQQGLAGGRHTSGESILLGGIVLKCSSLTTWVNFLGNGAFLHLIAIEELHELDSISVNRYRLSALPSHNNVENVISMPDGRSVFLLSHHYVVRVEEEAATVARALYTRTSSQRHDTCCG
eukprot:scaffold996_cov409-Prasinococcus_capsulatus_cf.AAC.32